MSMIDVTNLTFAYDGSYDNIFENVSFRIDTEWKLGFTGRNGRGKTTFLNLLLGKYEFAGNISANVDFEYFPYEVSDTEQLTIDVIAEVCPDFEQWRLSKELNLLFVSEDALYRPFCTLSNGERTKVLLAALFMRENSFLLIDEPTNHLDMAARKIVGSYLNSKQGFILVSHDRNFLDSCVDHILSINKSDIEVQRGNFSSWWANKESRDNFELAENEKLKKEIKHLSDAAKRSADWSDAAERRKIGINPNVTEKSLDRRAWEGAKAKKAMARSVAINNRRQNSVEEKARLLKNIESADSLKLSPLKYFTDKLLTLENVSVSYGEKTACRNVNLTVNSGDRIALCGRNGCGKSTVLKLICGQIDEYDGTMLKNDRLVISYVPQDASFLSGSLKNYAEENGLNESLFKTILRKLDFSRIQFEKDIADFSGGQKKKVMIAKSLCEQAHLYIWDEPLNYIDVFSRIQIEQLILDYRPTLLFVEHDEKFCDNIATKVIEI